MRYISSPDFHHDAAERIGVLLVNSGSPRSPEPRDVRKYLAAFLSDPRVIEVPRLLWLPILYGLILPFRPYASASRYRKVWSAHGSPLIDFSERLRTELATTLAQRILAPLTLELGMLYGDPTIPDALARLRASGAQRILVVPMFPQYCGATTGAVYDQVNGELRRWRWLPELRYLAEYHDDPRYIDALRTSIVQHWETHGRTKHLLISFHGIPERYFHQGDPYFCKCQKTARLLADELMLQDNEWSVSFQSRFGPAGWLKPYTSTVLAEMPARGIHEVTVVCPGFSVDCLETLEEVDIENRDIFLRAGGRDFQYIPALNARVEHARFLADLIAQHCQGWTHEELGRRPAGAARGASA